MSHDDEHAPLEGAVRAGLARGDVAGAVRELIAAYGAEVYGFLTAAIGAAPAARAVYASFADELHRDLPAFRWGFALRTFTYFVARREIRRRRDGASDDRRRAPASTPGLRAHRKSMVAAALRRSLSLDDRELLVLRVDRGLGWRDLAWTRLGEDAAERDLDAESTRLERRLVHLRAQIGSLTRRTGRR